MIVSCEQSPGNKAVPNQALLEEFVLRDKPQPKGALDTAKIAIKAGKAPFDLWSKLLTLVTTMNKGFLEKLKLKHQPALDPKILEMLNSLSDQKAVFSTAALVMARRIRSVYRVNIVQANLTAFDLPNGQRGVIFYLPNGASKAATKPHIFELRPGDGLKGEIAKLHKEVGLKDLPEPQGRLTFDHVKNVTSVIGLFFSVRDLYISGTDKGALDVTKSAFNVLKALYGLPWVSKRVTARITDVSLRRLSQELAGDEALHVAGLAAKRGVARIAFVVQIVTVGFAAHDVWSKSQTATKDQVVSSAVSLSCEVLLLISAGLVVASGGTMTPLAAVLAAAAAVISVAQFVYELFRPEEHVYAVRFCLFGVGFVESIGSPAGDARHWQACPKHDLRYFNPDFKGLDGLRTQIASFNNLMHGYGLQVSFTGAVAETGATVKIFPGAIPRQAYFEVKMTMEWWLSKAKGKVFTSPGDSWKAEYTYKFYPFADNVPPQPLQFSPQYYRDMRKHGVIDQRGGPFDVLVGRSANELMLYTYPKEAHIPKWTGVLNDIVGSTSVGAKIQKFYHAKYEVESKVVHKGGGKKDLEVTIELLPGSSDVAIQRMSVLAKMLQTGDGVVHDGGTVEFTADAASSVNGKGNREFTLIMPAPAPSPSGTFSFDTFQFKLKFIDADGHTPPKWGMQSEPMHPGQKMQVEEKTVSDPSKDTFHYRIDYDAQLIDDGTGPMLDFVVTKAFVRRKSEDPSKGKVTKDLFISGVVLQYVRNEGSGKPLEEGTLAKPLWTSMIRIGDSFNSHFRAHLNKKTYHSSPVLLFDRLTYRFSVETISDTGTKRWTGSNDDWTKRTVKWTYTSEEQAGRSFHTQLIKSAKCELRLVLDGDPDTRNFNPNDITLSSRRAYTVAEVSGSIGSIVWSPASHAGALGPPESKVVQSILACKVQ
ncbi:MAG: hypothetical protein K0V04_37190 [Deltaproteobacteria bacterium]|nr:hypothetical protein [Deltaproteobacteria bacterium]